MSKTKLEPTWAPTSIAEQEVVIRLVRETGRAVICSTWPAISRRLEKRYGPPARVSLSSEGGIAASFWELPEYALISFRRPTSRKRQRTGERRADAARRNGRFARETPENTRNREAISTTQLGG
jgi:hypothetical protein